MAAGARGQGFSLVEMMVAMSLGLLVLALALQGALTMQGSLRAIENGLRRHQDGQFALTQLAESWRRHGRFACAQAAESPGRGFEAPEGMRFRYGVGAAVVSVKEDAAQTMLRWQSEVDWEEAALASCSSLRLLTQGEPGLQWRRESGTHVLAWQGGAAAGPLRGADSASLEVLAIASQRYVLRREGDGDALWLEESRPGRAVEPPQLLATGVAALRQRFGVRRACRPLELTWRERPDQLSVEDWMRLSRVELSLEIQSDGRRQGWTTVVALTPALPCALEPSG
ncbi:prepilin-type N-terminal cleavage/methylation domain-containing protein [Chromobacterium haemolyticum]|uniref:Prepilin-type N-terminal cleavage/methylation domain-containing protein n=1 Tax=Chromobacterium fluminis TaxID=3044269 RepID=A0ABX0LA86_9NEIS|nr:prepilin-type N-terminal cleavage/methylation domain-containing protein [Chromobacterium haemolyticum]NHR06088.1 prepilin-type N-terminal cleavage/methylation domain-containing protein [Chromobacterium haemolyticum]